MSNVTVIIPVYNVDLYIEQCLDSVLNQTITNINVILINDGSTDDSSIICEEYALKDSRITLVSKLNQGQGISRNCGMDLAHSKYLIFLDSDDYWDIDTLKILIEEAEKNNLQVVQFSGRAFWDGIQPINKFDPYNHVVQNRIVKNGFDSYNYATEFEEYYTQPCMRLYDLDYIECNRLRFDEGIIHEDEKFSFLAYVLADRIECIENRLYYRRYRIGSTMSSKTTIESVYGYAIAMYGVLQEYLSRRSSINTESEERAFINQIKVYINNIRNQYHDQWKNKTIIREIEKSVQKYLKYAIEIQEHLDWRMRLSLRSLWLDYVVDDFLRYIRKLIRK